MATSKFSVGSDPELVLIDVKGNLRSAIGIVQGSSKNRIKVGDHEFYHDNVNVEMAIAPGTTKTQVLGNFRDAFKICAEMIAPFKMVPRASANFPPSELKDPRAKEIACDPEYCAYSLREIPKPVVEFQNNDFRSAGGHIHLGAEDGCLRDPFGFFFVVRVLDLFLGIPSLFMDHDPTSKARRELYGLAGSHRHKPYGVEYRALSNFWLASPKLVAVIYDVCDFAIEFVNQEKHLQFWTVNYDMIEEGEEVGDSIFAKGIDQEGLRHCIDTCDKNQAGKFLDLARSHMPKGLYSDLASNFEPVHYDFYKEWLI